MRKAGLSPSFLKEENILLASQGDQRSASQKIIEQQSSKRTGGQKSIEEVKDQGIKRKIAFVDNSVPDLKGLSLREILNITQGFDFKFNIQGSGRLVRTIPLTGKPVPENKKITLIFD